MVRAAVALKQGEPAKAIELLQTSVPYELGTPRSALQGYLGALYPIFVRGQAYLAARRGPEAVTEFQKILDRRRTIVGDPVVVLAHLQLGRAPLLSEDKVQAKSAYQDFLVLWRNADIDIPIYKEARREYASLP